MPAPSVVLEIGTSEIRVLVAEAREENQLVITGIGRSPSRGVRKGEVVDMENTVASVKAALREAETSANVLIRNVLLVFSGGHIRQLNNRGTITVMSDDRVIVPEDLQDVMNNARAVNIPTDREILHSIGQHYFVDDQPGVVNPEGMVGTRLSLDMLVLHGVRNRLRHVVRVADECDVSVTDAAFGGLCAALSVLSSQQKEGGAILIDLGAGTTDYVVYSDKTISRAGSLAVGGDHVTNDVALGLSLHSSQAEKLKLKHGSAMVDLGARDRKVSLDAESGFTARDIQVRDLHTVMHARMLEIFELVKSDIGAAAMRQRFGAGVVLTGGGARMPRIKELASHVFEMPSHIGLPKGVSGLTQPGESPEFAAPVGMFKYGMRNQLVNGRGFSFGHLVKSLFGRSG